MAAETTLLTVAEMLMSVKVPTDEKAAVAKIADRLVKMHETALAKVEKKAAQKAKLEEKLAELQAKLDKLA